MSELRRKPETDYYKVLQVDAEAEPEVVEAAYRALSKKYHPDLNPVPEAADRMSQINTAYGILGDSVKRREYNLLRGGINHYIKSPSPSSASSSPANPTYRPTTTANVSNNFTRTSTANPNPPKTSYKAASTSGATTNRATDNGVNGNTINPKAGSSARPRNPYQSASPPPPSSARSEAQNRAKGGNRAGHYVYDRKKRLSATQLTILVCGLVVVIVVGILVLENFLGNPFGTHFISHVTTPSVAPAFVPTEQVQIQPTVAATSITAIASSSDNLSHDTALAYLQSSNLFAGRVGQNPNDVTLNGDTLQLKLKLSDKGAGTNADIAATSTLSSNSLQNDPLAQMRNSETTAYAAIYALFHQFSPQLKRIVLGLTNPAGDTLVYKVDVTREAAFGFYSWQVINSSMTSADLTRLAADDRLVAHFGAPQDDKTHNLLMNPDEASLSAEIASRGIEGTTVTIEPSGTAVVSYLLNHNTAETQLDFVKIIYALYTRFPNFDRLQLTTAVAGQTGGTTVWCNRELFDKIGVSNWAQRLYVADVQELFSAIPKTDALLRQNTVINPPTPQPLNSTLRVRTWQVNVIKTEQLNGVPNFAPDGNSQLWAVTVDIRNNTSQQIYPAPDEIFSLLDSQRHSYQPDMVASVQFNLNNNVSNLAPLPAGQSERLTLIFSLPRTSNNQKLSLQVRDLDVKNQVYLQ